MSNSQYELPVTTALHLNSASLFCSSARTDPSGDHQLNCLSYSSDELIRQVTINCAERGLLLLRVRDEIRMTIAAYQTLYESSVAFGMRKALQAEQGKADMERKVRAAAGELAITYRDFGNLLF